MSECEHKRIVKDHFADLPGVQRYTLGDCVCLDCGKSLPLRWNGGHPIPETSAGQS